MLVDKVKIIVEVMHTEREKKEQISAQGRVKRDTRFTGMAQHLKEQARPDGPSRVEASVGSSVIVSWVAHRSPQPWDTCVIH